MCLTYRRHKPVDHSPTISFSRRRRGQASALLCLAALTSGCAHEESAFRGGSLLATRFPDGFRAIIVRDEAGREQWLSRDTSVYYIDPVIPNANGSLGRLVGTKLSTLLEACSRLPSNCYLRSPGAVVSTIAPGATIEPTFDKNDALETGISTFARTIVFLLHPAAILLMPSLDRDKR